MNMKVRCIDPGKHSALLKGEIYDGELINNDIIEEKRWKIKGHEHMSYFESRFEIVKDNKMEKTFREVIADIKEGEIWENEIYSISKDADGLSIKRLDKYIQKDIKDTPYMYLYDKTLFELQRKQYTFEEAFKAYEEGKEIESCENGYKYLQNTFTYPGNEQWLCFRNSEQMFTTDAIRGKWYIND